MATKRRILAGTTATLLAAGILAPAAQAQAAGPLETVEGSVEWNFKESFMGYVTGPFAKGEVTVSDGATWEKDQPFTFPIDSENTAATDNDTAVIELDGEVKFNAHGGVLNITVSDFELHVDGDKGALYVDYNSSPFSMEPGEEPVVGDDVKFVDITFAEPVDLSAPLDLSGATVLVESGQPVLSNYDPGDEFSPLTINSTPVFEELAPEPAPEPEPEPEPSETEESSTPAQPEPQPEPGDDEDKDTEEPSTEPSTPDAGDDEDKDADEPKNSSEGSSTEDDGLLARAINFLTTTLGLGALGAVLASIGQYFSNLLK